MNRIEQTTLSIEDINEHHNHLFWLAANKQKRDDMLERFVNTFLEDIESEVIK